MMPARLKYWIFVWAMLTWLLLELAWYPKDRYLSQGAGRVLGGFFDGRIGSYPAWALLGVALACFVWGIWEVLKDPRLRRLGAVIISAGLLLLAWALVAGGLPGWSPTGRALSFGWLFQTVLVALIAAAIWAWAAINAERAELLVWNVRQVWQLFRSNWQGMFGLCVLVIFVLIALLAPFLAAHTYLDQTAQIAKPFSGPSGSYYRVLGTDELGLSVLAEFIWSARISLAVGLIATLISTLIGAVVGIGAGFYGGWTQEISMRTTDIFLVLPWLPFAMVLAAAWGHSYGLIIVIIGVTCWPGTARLVRAETLKLRKLQFIERATAIGSTSSHTMRRHILPNVFPLIFANTVLVVAIAILSETTLSFLGLGDPMNFSWGTMLRNAWQSGAAGIPEWGYLFPPGIAIVLVVLGFTFVGQALDAVLDPKLRKRDRAVASRPGQGGKRKPGPIPSVSGSTIAGQPTMGLHDGSPGISPVSGRDES
jgi:peptide/nickel transport system permease protein